MILSRQEASLEDIACLLLFLSLLPGLMITMGLIYIFKKDWAWWITERMLRHVRPQRTAEWELSTTINGVIMLVGGLVIIVFVLTRLF